MVFLGLLLMLVAGGLTAGVLTSNSRRISPTPEIFGISLGDVSTTGLFLAGLATALAFALGLWMLLRGLARSRRRSVERRQIVRETREQQASLSAEKTRLERELEQERSRRNSAANPVTTERTVVEREPVRDGVQETRTEANDSGSNRTRLFRR